MRTKVSLYNTGSAMLLQVINVIVSLILPGIIITQYGSSVNGLVNSIRQCTQYLSVVEGGLAFAAVYALYKPLADNDRSSINGILSGANKLYNQSGYIFSALIVAGAFLYPVLVYDDEITLLTMAVRVIIIGG